ncbi:LOW QUALITY PROTEIN: hypothetical protein ACHAW5_002487 [Stephanodiscus triporus]|uniref:Uncharacterized protein n=1 Tax=Stephanodiscus triporus TaxID=2934178 RepID=A0ABD3QL80_9STRA
MRDEHFVALGGLRCLLKKEHAGNKPEVGKQPSAETQKEFNLPAGVKLTGNHQVDEDIIAFYKAKEVLLSKLKR